MKIGEGVAVVRTWRLGERRMEAEERALVEAMVWLGEEWKWIR